MTMYCDTNFTSGKAVRDAVQRGDVVRVRNLTPMGDKPVEEGVVAICGPWYPQLHKWYLQVEVRGGQIVKVKK